MLRGWMCGVLLAAAVGAAAATEEPPMTTRCYELRTYIAAPGRMANLHARFRNHTVKLLQKHGMKLVGFWTPVDKEDVLIYLVEHESREAAKQSWTSFRADPAWIEAKKASETEAGGTLTEKVESVFLSPTDYSAMK